MSRRESTIEERLRIALNVRLEDIQHGVAMTAAAITSRVRDACEMSTLALQLASNRRSGSAG